MKYLEYVSKMAAVDSRLTQVFLAMLEFQDMEEILTRHDMFISVLTPLQLLELLQNILERSSQFSQICKKILARFHEEILCIKSRSIDHKICLEDGKQIQRWSNHITAVLHGSFPASVFKKYELFNLFLNIIIACQPLLGNNTLAEELAQRICADLATTGNFPQTCQAWSEFLPKFSSLNQPIYKEMLKIFQAKVSKMKPEECLEALMTEVDIPTKEISDPLFARAVLSLEEKNQASNFWGKVKSYVGMGNNNDHRVKNLARFYSKCISDLKCYNLPCPQATEAITDIPAASKLIKFFPKLVDSSLLTPEVIEKTKWILAQVNQFLDHLYLGQLSLETVAMLKDEARKDYLILFQECSEDIKTIKYIFPSSDIKMLVKLRLKEMAEFYGAKQDIFGYLTRFEQTDKFKRLMSQFEVDQSMTQLVDICQPRSRSAATEAITLKLDQIHPEELKIVKRHHFLFNQSVIFRQIHLQA